MENIKITIIAPVYNVEPYLKECLDSLINQTLKEIEIICIDDCSTDNSYQILDEYAKKDDRIVILQNDENRGVGYTRNIGEKLAKGEYLYFIDPDDYISLNFLECMYNTAKKYNSDIVQTLNIYTNTNGKLNKYWLHIENILSAEQKNNISNYIEYESEASLKKLYKKNIETTNFNLWAKLYKKEFLIKNNLFSNEAKIGAGYDTELTLRILLHAPKLSHNNKAIYYYRIRKNSIVDKYKKEINRSIYIIDNMNNIIKYYNERIPDLLNDLYPNVFASCFYVFNISTENNKAAFYSYIHNFISKIHVSKTDIDKDKYLEYLLIKNNDTYEKYLLQKQLFEQIKLLDSKINNIIEKQNSKIKLFGIDNFEDKKIIYIFGIRITLKK
ncbi:glycosyltransferase [Brachyspira sp. SAP_772]|uniref:glycosyltransferase family 2 protein n=1 Tax=Brachyspira sp. SAP_772 TaxID=2608385 RepID=UPI0012F50CA6|nr:glycosyltransferase [Brachyspira sp. SAP_772]